MKRTTWAPAFASVLLLTACGDDGAGGADAAPPDATPPPPEVTLALEGGVTLTVDTAPLALRVSRGGATVLEAPRFVEVGTAVDLDPIAYVNPAAPDPAIRWRVAGEAVAWDPAGATLTLALDGGGTAALTVAGDALTLDTAGAPGAVLLRFVLPLAAGEEIYGLGELEDTPASRDVVREMQLRIDLTSQSSTNEVHVPVPLAIYPARELGFFAEERRVGAFDVGAARPDAMLVTYATPRLALRVLPGAPLAVLDRYTALTGRPTVPPEWAFAPFQWRNDHTDGAEVIADAMAIRASGIPGSTVWIDNPWQTGYNTFRFEPGRFPDPQLLVDTLADLGFRSMVWSTPYVDPVPPTDLDHLMGAGLGYFVTDGSQAFDWPWQNGPGALVDFTRPGATDWWRERIARVTALGVSGFKLDFGEDLVPDIGANKSFARLAGGTPETLHSYYARGYHEAYLGALPPGDGFLLTRAGDWGTQAATTCVWPGDLDNDFSRHDAATGRVGGLPAAVAAGLSLSASGFPFFGPDIGGFRGGVPTTESLLRWAEYAALGTVMQLGGGGGRGTSHNPWDTTLYGPEALPIYRRYARLHMDLFPYLYTYARQAGATGAPVTRAPGLVVPGHPYEDAFFVGDALFAAPVVDAGATTRTVTLPPGDWVDWWTGQKTAGGAPVTVPAPLDTLPLWRRVGALVVLLGTPVDTMVPATAPGVVSFADPANQRAIRVLATPQGTASFALYDGTQLAVEVAGAGATVRARAGTRHGDVTFELDWAISALGAAPPTRTMTPALPQAADQAALAACPAPGCWRWDAPTGRALVRLVDAGAGLATTLLP